MTTITPNAPLLNKTLDNVEKNPEEHNQEEWRCGTQYCFGGRSLVLAGQDNWASNNPGSELYDYLYALPGEEEYAFEMTGDDGRDVLVVSPADRAQRLLGLDEHQADTLFHYGNSIVEIRDIVRRIIGGEL